MYSALPEISKILQCNCSSYWKKEKLTFQNENTTLFPSAFQLKKYLCFINFTTFCLVFGLVTFFILTFSLIFFFFSSIKKISLFPRSHPMLIGKTSYFGKTGLIVTQFTAVSGVLCLLWAVRKGLGISELKWVELCQPSFHLYINISVCVCVYINTFMCFVPSRWAHKAGHPRWAV